MHAPTIPSMITLRFMTRDKRNAESHTHTHALFEAVNIYREMLASLNGWEGKIIYLFRMIKVILTLFLAWKDSKFNALNDPLMKLFKIKEM